LTFLFFPQPCYCLCIRSCRNPAVYSPVLTSEFSKSPFLFATSFFKVFCIAPRCSQAHHGFFSSLPLSTDPSSPILVVSTHGAPITPFQLTPSPDYHYLEHTIMWTKRTAGGKKRNWASRCICLPLFTRSPITGPYHHIALGPSPGFSLLYPFFV